MTRLLIIVTLLIPLMVIEANGQTPKEVKTEPGRLISIPVDIDDSTSDVKWDLSPELDLFREYIPDSKKIKLRVYVPPTTKPGLYRLLIITATKEGKLGEFSVCNIVVDSAKSDSIKSDSVKSDSVKSKESIGPKLAELYKNAAIYVHDPKLRTIGSFLIRFKADVSAKFPEGSSPELTAISKTINSELSKVLPSDPTIILNPELRSLIALHYNRIAAALEKELP